ncbi:DCC1-like thiol-disulfide oxidoreductase family protein [Rheinheimera hassiensis]|uniref:DCC1-like thiol-disulfide oxidoreductase family protein n=1 Tax=Rheinheimera hassiensis TaxID=1193627 RepID=UPI001F05A8B8|nr:DCC1-like thiol-disulfide oxidoreductase family protein [Rheinheimera hassiensis]
MAENPILLIYDKDCPACNAYCQMVRIRQSVGELKLINAREDTEVMQQITAQGLDIDQGMVLKMGDNWYYGSDAIYMLSLLSSRSGLFSRLNYHLFKSKRLAKWLYPLLRFFRNLLLKLLGKRKINNLGIGGNDRF